MEHFDFFFNEKGRSNKGWAPHERSSLIRKSDFFFLLMAEMGNYAQDILILEVKLKDMAFIVQP